MNLLIAAAFAVGVICGAALLHQFAPARQQRVRIAFGTGAGVYEVLDLTRDQRRRIDSILTHWQPRSDSLLHDVIPALRSLADSADNAVRATLTAPQRQRLDSLRTMPR